nr:MAG TPA_asm: hypothetical protein [Caudoviricetes sp.]
MCDIAAVATFPNSFIQILKLPMPPVREDRRFFHRWQ